MTQPSLEALQKQHRELLKLDESNKADITQVEVFLKELAASGAYIQDLDQRSLLRAYIRYWVSFVGDKTGSFPSIQLQSQSISESEAGGERNLTLSGITQAIKGLERVPSPELRDVEALMDSASKLEKSKQREEALKVYERIISLDPNNVKAWERRGAMLYLLNRDKEALEAYEKVIELTPEGNALQAWRVKAAILFDFKRYEDAYAACERALTLNCADSYVWSIKGDVLQQRGQNQEALVAYSHSLVLQPDNAWMWRKKGNLLRTMHKEKEAMLVYEEALMACELSISHDRKGAGNWEEKGLILRHLKRDEAALQAFKEALKYEERESKKASYWLNMGNIWRDRQQYDDAFIAYTHTTTLDPISVDAWNELGRIYLRRDQCSMALDAFERALQYAQDRAYLWRNKGLSLLRLASEKQWNEKQRIEKLVEALDASKRAIELDPKYTSALEQKGHILRKLGHYEEALEVFDQALDLNDKNPWIWNGKGYLLADLQRYDEALKSIEQAIKLAPYDPNFWDSKGEIYMMMHEYDKALEVLNKAIELGPLLESLEKKLTTCQRLNLEKEASETEARIRDFKDKSREKGEAGITERTIQKPLEYLITQLKSENADVSLEEMRTYAVQVIIDQYGEYMVPAIRRLPLDCSIYVKTNLREMGCDGGFDPIPPQQIEFDASLTSLEQFTALLHAAIQFYAYSGSAELTFDSTSYTRWGFLHLDQSGVPNTRFYGLHQDMVRYLTERTCIQLDIGLPSWMQRGTSAHIRQLLATSKINEEILLKGYFGESFLDLVAATDRLS